MSFGFRVSGAELRFRQTGHKQVKRFLEPCAGVFGCEQGQGHKRDGPKKQSHKRESMKMSVTSEPQKSQASKDPLGPPREVFWVLMKLSCPVTWLAYGIL